MIELNLAQVLCTYLLYVVVTIAVIGVVAHLIVEK